MAGLKKQFHKARQILSEKISGVKETKLEDKFVEMERKFSVTNKCVKELVSKATASLLPTPFWPEGHLGNCMLRYGHELGGNSLFGCALVDSGQAMKQIAGLKHDLDIETKQSFIDPLQNLKQNHLGEIMHHLKKTEDRRLDLDYKKMREGKISTEEIQEAFKKFEKRKILAEECMVNLLEKDSEQVSHLSALITATSEYHRQSHSILQALSMKLQERSENKSKPESARKSIESITRKSSASNQSADHMNSIHSFCPGTPIESLHQFEELGHPCCQSLYDFESLNEGDLALKAGDLIMLTNQLDENWYEGMLNGVSGFFPINYVEVIVPLPE